MKPYIFLQVVLLMVIHHVFSQNQNDSIIDSRDGKIYKTVKIGNQWWMAENLAYLPSVSPPHVNSFTDSVYYVLDYMGNNITEAKTTAEYAKHGVLYNWQAATKACPSGWHLPSEREWNILKYKLGKYGVGAVMKVKTYQSTKPDSCITNETGFSALPCGEMSGRYFFHYTSSSWWSLSEKLENLAYKAQLWDNNDELFIIDRSKDDGYSVRCIKDNGYNEIGLKSEGKTAPVPNPKIPVNESNKNTGIIKDKRDGNIYKTIKIGIQWWMAENLAYLPSVSPDSIISNYVKHYYVFDYKGSVVSEAKENLNYIAYGVLYNFPAAKTSCPLGWHLPSDAEWKRLQITMGMTQKQTDSTRVIPLGTNQGARLKGTSGWQLYGCGKNTSGFNGLPGGCLLPGHYFAKDEGIVKTDFWEDGLKGYWWSSTEYAGNNVWTRGLRYDSSGIVRDYDGKDMGLSVRCVKD